MSSCHGLIYCSITVINKHMSRLKTIMDGDLLCKELNYLFIYIDNFIVILQSASSLLRLRDSRVR